MSALLAVLVLFSSSVFAPVFADVPRACPAAVKTFPFLKPWAEKLSNFAMPTAIGQASDSLLYSIGVTTAKKGVAELWMKDSGALKISSGKFETTFLGEPQSKAQSGGWSRLWERYLAPVERELLARCRPGHCKVKLNDHEVEAMGANTTNQGREALFRDIVRHRIENFKKSGMVAAYEGTTEALRWASLPLGRDFPNELGQSFTAPQVRNNYGFEVLDAQPGKHKPVTALFSRHCEKKQHGQSAYTACTDFVVYNNHYFDFWGRIVLFFPWCNGELVMVYESADIDQLKGSRVARLVFGGEMRRLFGLLLEARLQRLHMLGS